jgi:leader peptidase (prepilin peptidase)/N-methyltransferase
MIIAILIVLGLCLGSFVNALVWRLREQAERAEAAKATSKKARKAQDTQKAGKQIDNDLSILKGRSMCPHCRHTLAAKDLLPVISWVLLAGKCRYCHKPVSRQYPLVELLTAGAFVFSYLVWPLGFAPEGIFDLVIWLLIVVCFMALSLYDLKWFELPDKLLLPLTGLVAIQSIVDAFVFGGGWHQLGLRAAGMLIIGGLFLGLYLISKGNWIGFGDVKMAPALGLLAATPLKSVLVIFLASVLGTLATLPLLARGKAHRNSHIPFGPFLIIATIIVVLFGDAIVGAYLDLMRIN